MTLKSKASKSNTNGVSLDTSGDQFAISLKFGAPGIENPPKQVIFTSTGDTTAPVITVNQSFNYQENQSDGFVIGTVQASDNSGVVSNFIFANSGTGLSSDGYYSISTGGLISLTSSGAAAGVATNDFETPLNSFTYGIRAIDAAGNRSEITNVTFNVTNDTSDDGGGGTPGFSGTFDVIYRSESPLTTPTKATALSASDLAKEYNYVAGPEDSLYPDDPNTPVDEQYYSGTCDPYFIMMGFAQWTVDLPGYSASDLIGVSLFENTANASYDADLYLLLDRGERLAGVFENYNFQGSWHEGNGLDIDNIGAGDTVTLTFTGGVTFTLDWAA